MVFVLIAMLVAVVLATTSAVTFKGLGVVTFLKSESLSLVSRLETVVGVSPKNILMCCQGCLRWNNEFRRTALFCAGLNIVLSFLFQLVF